MIYYIKQNEGDPIKFKRLIRNNGRCEVDEYLNSLPHKVKYKLAARLKIIPVLGIQTASKIRYVKKIVSYPNLFEVRMRFSHRQERIMYCQLIHDTFVLLCGGTKTSPQKQRKMIRHANNLRRGLKEGIQNGSIKII